MICSNIKLRWQRESIGIGVYVFREQSQWDRRNLNAPVRIEPSLAVYVTNAVKHFKFVPRGKIRLHQKPNTSEIKACRQWYERELASVKPALVVAMGATAAQSVFGKITPINKNRGRPVDLDDGIKALVTVHPSYLLRLPDADAKAREYERFVGDLKIAAALLRKSAHAA
jgi:uracil-DNA glycosylase family protein